VRPFDAEVVEQPFDVLGHAAIRRGVRPVPVATGEHVANPVMFKQFLQAGGLDIMQIDACRVAGVNENIANLLLAATFTMFATGGCKKHDAAPQATTGSAATTATAGSGSGSAALMAANTGSAAVPGRGRGQRVGHDALASRSRSSRNWPALMIATTTTSSMAPAVALPIRPCSNATW